MSEVLKFPEEYIDEFDSEDLLSDIKELPTQLKEGYDLVEDITLQNPSKVIITGMGSSFSAGHLLKSYLRESGVMVIANQDYSLPETTDGDSLVIAISYSGNTEETVSAYREAVRKKCSVISLSRGGKLRDLSDMNDTPFVKLPSGYKPRVTLGYQVGALLGVLEEAGIIRNAKSQVKNASKALKLDVFEDYAKKISEKLEGRIPLIYSSKTYYPVGYRWQNQFNENSKIIAHSNVFSDLNHNEVEGFRNADQQGSFQIVMLQSQDDAPKIKQRMKTTRKIAQDIGVDVTQIGIKGNSYLTRLLSGVMIGDLSSYYLALRNEVDPSDIGAIEKVKNQL